MNASCRTPVPSRLACWPWRPSPPSTGWTAGEAARTARPGSVPLAPPAACSGRASRPLADAGWDRCARSASRAAGVRRVRLSAPRLPATQPMARSGLPALAIAVPTPAFAAGGRGLEEVLLVFAAVSALLLLVWAAFFFSPLRRHFMRRDADYKRVLLPLLGLVGIAFGLTAAITGQVYLPGGSSVLRVLEPGLFWRYVGLELGAGAALIVLGLLYPSRRP